MSRMDRYNDTTKVKRADKNKDLYQDIARNPRYTNLSEIANISAYEIGGNNENANSRESYQQMKKYRGDEYVPPAKKELDDFKYLYKAKEKKTYDINSVLEEARKNRLEKDELEEKRKLKYTSYNILAGVNLEELIKYREEKKKRDSTPEEEGIRELIDTIASKTLAGELDKDTTVDLLSDLMATNMLDKVAPQEEIEDSKPSESDSITNTRTSDPELEETIEKLELTLGATKDHLSLPDKKDEYSEDSTENDMSYLEDYSSPPEKEEDKIDDSFYTKSMDLSNEDFEMANDFKEKSLPLPVKIFIVLLILIVIAVAAYFIYMKVK